MKKHFKTIAGVLLAIALVSILGTVKRITDGKMVLPADQAEREGFIAALVGIPVILLIASAVLYIKAPKA